MKFIDVAASGKNTYVVRTPEVHVFFLYNYSGELTIHMACPQAQVYIFGLYIGKGTDNFSLHTTQHHAIGSTISDLLIKGVFYDESKFLYEGLIQIDKGAQQSNAYQKNQNLLLSPTAFVDSRPFLEIKANDVRCTHASTTGRLNRDQLSYIHARGLPQKQAEELLVMGFVQDVFNRMQEIGCSTKDIENQAFTLFSQK